MVAIYQTIYQRQAYRTRYWRITCSLCTWPPNQEMRVVLIIAALDVANQDCHSLCPRRFTTKYTKKSDADGGWEWHTLLVAGVTFTIQYEAEPVDHHQDLEAHY